MIERHKSGYTRIPGSDQLRTGKGIALDEDRARLGSVDVSGHKLGRVVLRDAFVPVSADVFDRMALDQEPEELAVFMHLWRLSVGEERNWCRVSRAELERRVRMSQLRLGKALAGLVDKGHIALVDRSREGTLYRVMLPHELGRAAPAPAPAPVQHRPAGASSVGELVAWFADHGGGGRGRAPDEVLEEVLALVEDGVSLDVIKGALERFVAEMPKKTPIAELSRFVR
jgi:hypothetical protein